MTARERMKIRREYPGAELPDVDPNAPVPSYPHPCRGCDEKQLRDIVRASAELVDDF